MSANEQIALAVRSLGLRARRWYRRNWRGYQGKVIPLRCKLGRHDWSPQLLARKRLRMCRNCLREDRT